MPRQKKTKTEIKGDVKKTKPVEVKSTETMLSIPVYNLEGKEERKVELPGELFNIKPNKALIAQYIRIYLSNQRQGTASTKTRGEVIGSTKKIYRQKGTGNARHGSKKAPIFVGGGVYGGPKPTDYSLKMNKKQKRNAFFSVLSQKAKEGAIMSVVDEALDMQPKTKTVVKILKALGITKGKVLFVLPDMKKNGLLLSARNIAGVELFSVTNLNPYIVLNTKKIVLIEKVVPLLKDFYTNTHAD